MKKKLLFLIEHVENLFPKAKSDCLPFRDFISQPAKIIVKPVKVTQDNELVV